MRLRVDIALVVLMVGALSVVGCDQIDELIEEHVEGQADEQDDDDDEPDFDKDEFAKAAYEVRCVEQEIADGDEAEAIKVDHIYPRYGFADADDFEAAEEHFDGEEDVELEIETRMERCDEERAHGFAEAGAGELQQDEDELAAADDPAEVQEDDHDFERDDFMMAAYEVRCVERELDEDEAEELKTDHIFPRYEFDDAEEFEEAAEVFEGDEVVEVGIEARMEQCDELRARAFEDGVAVADLEDDDDEDEQEAPDVDQPEYVQAAFEAQCIEQELDEDEYEIDALIEEVILPEHDIEDTDEFEAAADYYGDEEAVQMAIDAHMQNCDERRALEVILEEEEAIEAALGEDEDDPEEEADDQEDEVAQDDEEDEEDEEEAEPPYTGQLNTSVRGSGFSRSNLRLTVNSDFSVTGRFHGRHNGDSFSIALAGSVDEETNRINVSGRDGRYSANVSGTLHSDRASGSISGDMGRDRYRVNYTAR